MILKSTTLAALAGLSMAGIASAVTTISYTSYVAANQLDTSWLNPTGYTSVARVNFGGGDTTFGPNGEIWLGSNVPNSFNADTPIRMYYHAPGEAWGSTFQAYYPGGPDLLNTGVWNGPDGLATNGVDYRLDLNDFTEGQQYRVQFVLADTRGFSDSTVQIDGYSANIDGQDSGIYQYAYTTEGFLVVSADFTPGAGDTAIAFRPITNGSNMQVNAVQVLTIPEPSAALLGAAGMICLMRRRRA